MRAETPSDGDRDATPWWACLRPDALTRRRLRRRLLADAAPLLRARRSWMGVAAEWARPLAPLAAGLTLAFVALAWMAAGEEGRVAVAEPDPVPWESEVAVGFVGAEGPDAPPGLLTAAGEPDPDGILAAIVYPSAPGPASAGGN